MKSEWKPIDSAPRDGRFIDVWGFGQRFTDVQYKYGDWWQLYTDEDGFIDTRQLKVGHGYIQPTHWMPLPEPPEATP